MADARSNSRSDPWSTHGLDQRLSGQCLISGESLSIFFQIIHLFASVLMGSFDGAVFRYFLLVCDFIDLVDWRSVDDFRAFAAVIYPFLNVSQIFHGFKLYEMTPQ